MGFWYVEKYTAERRARPRDRQEARRICRSCFNEAVKAEQTASVPLPGTADVSRYSRVTADIGKCLVCGVAKAVWLDRKAGVKLSEDCTGRGVRDDAREAVHDPGKDAFSAREQKRPTADEKRRDKKGISIL